MRKLRDITKLAKTKPGIVDQVVAGKVTIAEARRELKRETVNKNLESVKAKAVKEAKGVFDVIVLDPPWPMEKIERDVAPDQVAFEYPTMTEAELGKLKIPADDACHVWVWTTHKFLPMALRLLDVWRLKYVCTFVWHKPGGFQPFGLPQYNCEFALYARRGSPEFIETKAFPVCFSAPRGAHSEKPNAFYDMVRRVTGGRRLDMFNRRKIEGFDGWGNEAQ
jgi:N6-adenosine-specific RNA methylase IME4